MKKLFIITGVIAFFGISNLAIADGSWFSYGWFPSEIFKKKTTKKTTPAPPPPPPPSNDCTNILGPLQKQLQVDEKQLQKKKEVYDSITGSRDMPFHIPSHKSSSHFFLDPNFIYTKNIAKNNPSVKSFYMKILNDEKNIYESENLNYRNARQLINERLQYAKIIDKVVSLQTFTEAEERFGKIEKLSAFLSRINDLKGFAEMQVRINGMIAVIQNEATKLQMVAHFSEAEQALINQQKRALYLRVFQREFTKMPAIKINANSP